MRMLALLAFSVLLGFAVVAQTQFSGTVKDGKGKPLSGASIAIKNSYDGATTDSLGRFHFSSTEKGNVSLLVSSIGYKPYEEEIVLSGTVVTRNIILKEEPNELTAVTISAGTFEASDTKRGTVLTSLDVLTTASANADITGALKTLPGTQQVGESEGLFVRGGTAQETKVFIDGTLVNNFFFSSVPDIAQRGRFSPFIFKGTVFSSGGYSALYGQGLSGALILESVDLPERSSANVGISTVALNGGYQQLAKNKRSSWGVTYNYINLAAYYAVFPQRPDHFRIPEFHNGDFNFRIKTSKTGMLKFYSYFNYNRLGLSRADIDSVDLKDAFSLNNFNVYSNLSWKEKLGRKWRINFGSSYTYNKDKIGNELQDQNNTALNLKHEPFDTKSFELISNGSVATAKVVLERRLVGLSAFRFGGEYIYSKERNDYSNQHINNAKATLQDHYKAAFAEADIYLTNDLAAKFGGRFEHSSLLNSANIAPRISLAYKIGLKGQASFAYGMFYQKPDKEFYLNGYTSSDLQYQRATHYILNYQKISRDYTLRAEVFYKKYNDLIKTYITDAGILPDSAGNGGFGYAKGFELFWRDRRTIKNFDYWISYSYLDTKRDYLNYPFEMQPTFAAKHTASLVVKKFVTAWKTQFNGSYTFATGRPYYYLRPDLAQNKFNIADQGKTIPYHNLSFSVNYLPSIGKKNAKKFTVFIFSVTNVLGSDQVFGYNFSYTGARKEAIIPPSRRFYFLGCFMSFGVDRSEDVINNNL
jgi:vitamin B12 transporter